MTYREWAEKHIPYRVDPAFFGGVWGCPRDYGFNIKVCPCDLNDVDCKKCWDREMSPKDAERVQREEDTKCQS